MRSGPAATIVRVLDCYRLLLLRLCLFSGGRAPGGHDVQASNGCGLAALSSLILDHGEIEHMLLCQNPNDEALAHGTAVLAYQIKNTTQEYVISYSSFLFKCTIPPVANPRTRRSFWRNFWVEPYSFQGFVCSNPRCEDGMFAQPSKLMRVSRAKR